MNIFLIILIILFLVIFILFILYWFYSKNSINDNNRDNPIFSDIKTSCLYDRFGCCNDHITPRLDQQGSNCRGF